MEVAGNLELFPLHLRAKTEKNHVYTFPSTLLSTHPTFQQGEISSSHGGEYEVQNCLLGCTAV
jgi:hypothetical protein